MSTTPLPFPDEVVAQLATLRPANWQFALQIYTEHGHFLRFFLLTAKTAKNAKEKPFLCALSALRGSILPMLKTAICGRSQYISLKALWDLP
ncbi:MAG: hypothetical protein HY869_03080 [Chloroflexi bacterium]|nr:hypothetical protein [Chloroflexota bacterium]